MGASAVPREVPAPLTPIRGLLERSERRKEPPYGKWPDVPHVCAADGQRPPQPQDRRFFTHELLGMDCKGKVANFLKS